MEQMTLFKENNWKYVVNDILTGIISEEELPEKSLVLILNTKSYGALTYIGVKHPAN